MGRKKEKTWKASNFCLDVEIKEKLKEISSFENMSQTELIEFLVANWDAGVNPIHKLENLKQEKTKLKKDVKVIQKQIEGIETKIDNTSKHIVLFNEWNNQKSCRKGEAINVLKRLILNKRFEDAERVSKTWQRITGIQAIELLLSAKEIIEKTGV